MKIFPDLNANFDNLSADKFRSAVPILFYLHAGEYNTCVYGKPHTELFLVPPG